MNEIYVIRKGETYYDATVCGYFTDKDKAERYCVLNEDCFIETTTCLDDLDLPESNIAYEYSVNFCNCGGTWKKYCFTWSQRRNRHIFFSQIWRLPELCRLLKNKRFYSS